MYPSAQSIVLVPCTLRRSRRRRRDATSLSTPTPGDEFDPSVPLVTGVFPSVWFQVSPCLFMLVFSGFHGNTGPRLCLVVGYGCRYIRHNHGFFEDIRRVYSLLVFSMFFC